MKAPRFVVGIDPGARWTAVVGIDLEAAGVPPVLVAATIIRPPDRWTIEQVPRDYLLDVMATITAAVRTIDADLIAVEGVRAPTGHAKGRKGHIIAPGPILGTATVLGSILGRDWPAKLIRVPPGGNGSGLPLNRYPPPLATIGKGGDARRHERSAYDVALRARTFRLDPRSEQ